MANYLLLIVSGEIIRGHTKIINYLQRIVIAFRKRNLKRRNYRRGCNGSLIKSRRNSDWKKKKKIEEIRSGRYYCLLFSWLLSLLPRHSLLPINGNRRGRI